MDRSSQLAKAQESLTRSWATLERALQSAREGDPYLASCRPAIQAWQESMSAWRCGTAGAKRTIALAAEMERAIAGLRAGYDASQETVRAEAARRRADAAARVAAEQRAAAAAEHRRVLAGQAEVARRQALEDARGHRRPAVVRSLFAPGDLRDAGPG